MTPPSDGAEEGRPATNLSDDQPVCRNCGEVLPPRYAACPQCGVRQTDAEGYEWKTNALWLGEPIVHVAFGSDASGRVRTARGIIAIGQRAQGLVAIGIVAFGGVAIGVASFGVVSAGVMAVGLGAAFGVNAFGFLAIGVFGAGYFAGGVKALGWKILFSV